MTMISHATLASARYMVELAFRSEGQDDSWLEGIDARRDQLLARWGRARRAFGQRPSSGRFGIGSGRARARVDLIPAGCGLARGPLDSPPLMNIFGALLPRSLSPPSCTHHELCLVVHVTVSIRSY